MNTQLTIKGESEIIFNPKEGKKERENKKQNRWAKQKKNHSDTDKAKYMSKYIKRAEI